MSVRRRRYNREPVAIAGRLAKYQRSAAGDELSTLNAAWSEIAGRQAARQSVVVRRSRAGVVSVACASAMWAQELDARRDLLADRLTRMCPDIEITGLRFVVGDHAIPGDVPDVQKRVGAAPTQEEVAIAAEAMSQVSDPVLRELLKRAAAGQIANARAADRAAGARTRRSGDGRAS